MIEDFDMDNIDDREIDDFLDNQNNVDFKREGQIMKGQGLTHLINLIPDYCLIFNG